MADDGTRYVETFGENKDDTCYSTYLINMYSHHSGDPSELSSSINDAGDTSSLASISSGKSTVVPVELLETGDNSSCTIFLFLVVVEWSDLDTDEEGPGWAGEPSHADIPVVSADYEIKNY